MQQGLQQGLQEGLQEGIKQTNLKNAKGMKDMGLPIETIQKITGLTEEEIKAL